MGPKTLAVQLQELQEAFDAFGRTIACEIIMLWIKYPIRCVVAIATVAVVTATFFGGINR